MNGRGQVRGGQRSYLGLGEFFIFSRATPFAEVFRPVGAAWGQRWGRRSGGLAGVRGVARVLG
jgi:hypothetical protein